MMNRRRLPPSQSARPRRWIFPLRVVVALSLAAASSIDPSHASGSQWYPLCGSCHGEHAEGLDTLSAPRLQGLSPTYLARQLQNFRQGRRGAQPSDTTGQQMASMAEFLPDEAAVVDVARFASALPPPTAIENRSRSVASLPPLFALCAACHGANAQGNEALGAPRLAGQRAEYLLRQFRQFRTGLRGADPADTAASSMAAFARTIADDPALGNLMESLQALPEPTTGAVPDNHQPKGH